MKKVIVWLLAVLMGQMVAASDVDLYRGLLFWIKDQNNIEGNELRKTTYPLSQVFDGSFNNQLAGTVIPKGTIKIIPLAFRSRWCQSFANGRRSCYVLVDTTNRPQYILKESVKPKGEDRVKV